MLNVGRGRIWGIERRGQQLSVHGMRVITWAEKAGGSPYERIVCKIAPVARAQDGKGKWRSSDGNITRGGKD